MTQTTINQTQLTLNSNGMVGVQENKAVKLREPNEQEVALVSNIRKNININDTGATIKYGAEAQVQLSQFTDSVLQNVKMKDVGEAGKPLNSMLDEMQRIDFDSIKKSDGFFANLPIISYWMKKGIKSFVGDFNTVQERVGELMTTMRSQEVTLLEDIKMFDEFYAQNLSFIRNIELYIIAGEEELVELHKKVNELKEIAARTQDPLDAQNHSDLFKAVDRFEKRLHNLKISRIASINAGVHIRLAQEADKMSVEDINDIITNTIPLWKNQFVMAISLVNTEKAIKLNKTVKDYTNKQYVDNAKKLNSVVDQLAIEYGRGILDIDSLKEVNKLTVDTIQKSLNTHKEASKKRKEAEKDLTALENEIKTALLDAKNQGGL